MYWPSRQDKSRTYAESFAVLVKETRHIVKNCSRKLKNMCYGSVIHGVTHIAWLLYVYGMVTLPYVRYKQDSY